MRTIHVWLLGQYILHVNKSSTYKYRCIRSHHDRLGFYAEIQIIFGTVWLFYSKGCPQNGTFFQTIQKRTFLKYQKIFTPTLKSTMLNKDIFNKNASCLATFFSRPMPAESWLKRFKKMCRQIALKISRFSFLSCPNSENYLKYWRSTIVGPVSSWQLRQKLWWETACPVTPSTVKCFGLFVHYLW